MSEDPERHLRTLQTGNAGRLSIFHTQSVDASKIDVMEKLIHRQNSRRRINGEWFRLTVEEAIAEVEFAMIRYDAVPNLKPQFKSGMLHR
jgi:T5orf172 domain